MEGCAYMKIRDGHSTPRVQSSENRPISSDPVPLAVSGARHLPSWDGPRSSCEEPMPKIRFWLAAVFQLLCVAVVPAIADRPRAWASYGYQIAQGSFQTRMQPRVSEIGGKFFLFGGYWGDVPARDPVGDLEMYDPETFTFTNLHQSSTGDVPSARYQHGMTAVGDQLLVVGGRTRVGEYTRAEACSSEFFRYVPATNHWTRLADFRAGHNGTAGSGRCNIVMAGSGGHVYAFGGESTAGEVFADLHSFELANAASAHWTLLSSTPFQPAALGGGTCDLHAVDGDRLLLWCGYTQTLAQFWVAENRWESMAETGGLPLPRWEPNLGCPQKLVGDSSEIFVVGACVNETDTKHGSATHVFATLDLGANEWTCGCSELSLDRSPLSDSTYGWTPVYWSDAIFFFGGAHWESSEEEEEEGPPSPSSCAEEEVVETVNLGLGVYLLPRANARLSATRKRSATGEWARLDTFVSGDPPAVYGHAMAAAGDKILIYGGLIEEEAQQNMPPDGQDILPGEQDTPQAPQGDDSPSCDVEAQAAVCECKPAEEDCPWTGPEIWFLAALNMQLTDFVTQQHSYIAAVAAAFGVTAADVSIDSVREVQQRRRLLAAAVEVGTSVAMKYSSLSSDTAQVQGSLSNLQSLLSTQGFDLQWWWLPPTTTTAAVIQTTAAQDDPNNPGGGQPGDPPGNPPGAQQGEDPEPSSRLATTTAAAGGDPGGGNGFGTPPPTTSTQAELAPPSTAAGGGGGANPPTGGPPPGRRRSRSKQVGGKRRLLQDSPSEDPSPPQPRENEVTTAAFWVYYPALHLVEEVDVSGPRPSPRFLHTMAEVGGSACVFGGKEDSKQDSGGLNDTWCVDPYSLSWTRFNQTILPSGESIPTSRYSHGAVGLQDQMLVFGGRADRGHALGDLLRFRPASGLWEDVSAAMTGDAPGARADHGMAVHEEEVYVFGGAGSTPTSLLDLDIHILDVHTLHWRKVEPFNEDDGPGPLAACSLSFASGKMVVHGSNDGRLTYAPFHVYDPVSNLWQDWHQADAFAATWVRTAALSNGKTVAFGGGLNEDGGLVPSNQLYMLPTPTTISLRFFGADLASAFDGDRLLVASDSTVTVSHRVKLGDRSAERLELRGSDPLTSTILRVGAGSIGCDSLQECEHLRLEQLRIVCDGHKAHLPPLQVAGQGATLELFGVTVKDCKSDSNGGSIRAVGGAVLQVHDSEVVNCSSDQSGGALWAEGGNVQISSSNFTACTAGRDGGAIAARPAIQTVELDGLITQADTPPTISLKECQFTHNTAGGNGGAVFLHNAWRPMLSGSLFDGNEARGTHTNTGNGGAIAMIQNTEAVLSNVYVQNNRAPLGGGGGLFWDTFPPLVATDGRGAAEFQTGMPHIASRDAADLCKEYRMSSSPRGTINCTESRGEGGRVQQRQCITGLFVNEEVLCGQQHGNVAKFGSCVGSSTDPRVTLLNCTGATELGSVVVPCDQMTLSPGLALHVAAQLVDCHGQIVESDSTTFVEVDRDYQAHFPQPSWLISPGAAFAQQDPQRAVEGRFPTVDFKVVLLVNLTGFSAFLAQQNGDPGRAPSTAQEQSTFAQPQGTFAMEVHGVSQSGLELHGGPVRASVAPTGLCPTGYFLRLNEQVLQEDSELRIGQCERCPQGSYVLHPLHGSQIFAGNFDAAALPGCFNCPKGGQCDGGHHFQNTTGQWRLIRGAWILESCQDGQRMINTRNDEYTSDLTKIDHGSQTCEACQTGEYFINPRGGPCKKCPDGATCPDGWNLVATDGSIWEVNPAMPDEYWLTACPAGHRLVNQGLGGYTSDPSQVEHKFQKCDKCVTGQPGAVGPPAEYIISPNGGRCVVCPQGASCDGSLLTPVGDSYWDFRPNSPDEYMLLRCPSGTRLVNLADGGYTQDPSLVEHDSQRCDSCPADAYIINPNGGQCIACPSGASVTCDGSKLLPTDGSQWEIHPTRPNEYILRNCPNGSRLVNSNDLSYTADDELVVHDSQKCEPCDEAHYIINPIGGQCVPCPSGATCTGGWMFEGKLGSRWAIREDPNSYELIGCPRGSKMSLSPQECQPCRLGEYVLDSNDPKQRCLRCPDAAVRCRPGEGPVFQLQQITLTLAITCSDLDHETVDQAENAIAELLNLDEDDVDLGEACGTGDAAQRRSMETVVVTLTVDESLAPALVSQADTASFAQDLQRAVSEVGLELSLQGPPIIGRSPESRPEGEVWVLDTNTSVFRLTQCPNGSLLINTTEALQQCQQCNPLDEYTLSDTDGCKKVVDSIGQATWRCDARSCHPCPSGSYGALCQHGVFIRPKVAEAVWVDEQLGSDGDATGTRRIKRIVQCPPGYIVKRVDSQPAGDECLPCDFGTYTREAAVYPPPADGPDLTSANGNLTCIPCPRGSFCAQGARLPLAEEGYWRGRDMHCEVNRSADSRNNLWQHDCLDLGKPKEGKLEDDEEWRRVSRVYRCPPKYCLGTNLNGTGTDNLCREGHEGVVCAICSPGWAIQNGVCAPCETGNQDGDAQRGQWVQRYILPPIFIIVLLIFWYFFAWRPLMQSESGIETYVMGGCMACASLPLMSMITKTVGMFKQLAQGGGNGQGGGLGHIQMVFKIIVGFFQILGSTLGTFEIRWPSILTEMIGWTSYLQFNFISMPGTACVFRKTTYYDKLRAQTLFPAVTLLLLLVPSLYTFVSGLAFHGGLKNHPKHTAVMNRFYQSCMIFLFLIYPSVSTNVLRSLNCKDYGTDGVLLYEDHRVDCNGPEYHKIKIWALVCVVLYPIGIPAFMLLSMIRAGVWRVATEKRASARFTGLLQLRKQQLSTMTRSAVAHSIGYPGHLTQQSHKEEFDRRIKYVYRHGVSTLFRESGQADDGEEQQKTLRPRDLRVAIARIAQIDHKIIPLSDVKELVDKYDPDQNGLDYEEFTEMLTALVKVHVRFTGHENLGQLTLPQLRSLRAHDWSLPIPDHHDGDESEDDDAQEEHDVDEDEAELNENDVPEHPTEAEDLRQWIRDKALELENSGLLAVQNLKWKDDGSPEEGLAISRLGFLFLAYKVHVWWFEVLVMVQKLLLSSVLVFLYTGTASQVAIGFFITFAFLLLVLINRPLMNGQLQTLQVYALVTQALNMFFGIMLITAGFQETAGTSADDSFFPYLLFVLNISVIVMPIFQMVVESKALIVRFRGLMQRLKRMTKIADQNKDLERYGSRDSAEGSRFNLFPGSFAGVSGKGTSFMGGLSPLTKAKAKAPTGDDSRRLSRSLHASTEGSADAIAPATLSKPHSLEPPPSDGPGNHSKHSPPSGNPPPDGCIPVLPSADADKRAEQAAAPAQLPRAQHDDDITAESTSEAAKMMAPMVQADVSWGHARETLLLDRRHTAELVDMREPAKPFPSLSRPVPSEQPYATEHSPPPVVISMVGGHGTVNGGFLNSNQATSRTERGDAVPLRTPPGTVYLDHAAETPPGRTRFVA